MANAERCENCRALISMVGRVHRCVAVEAIPQSDEGDQYRSWPITSAPASGDLVVQFTTTYRYRSAEARRAYMRDYMRRRRAKEVA